MLDFSSWNKKKEETKDVGLIEDMIPLICNLIHTEWHSIKSYFETNDQSWLELNEEARKDRTELMDELIKEHDGEIWCLTPNIKIITIDGTKKISDINVGDFVLTHNNRFKRVINKYIREVNEKIIKITTNYSNIDLEATGNHLFYIANNLRIPQKSNWKKEYTRPTFIWKEARNLTRNDFIYLPRYNIIKDIDFIDINYEKIYKNKCNNGIDRFKDNLRIPINNDVMRLIGLYLSEGHQSKGFNKIKKYPTSYMGLTFSIEEEELANFVISTFNKYFNYSTKPTYRKSTIEFSINKRVICKFFEQFGCCAHEKKIPDWIIKLPISKLKYMVKGLIEGDGNISRFDFKYATVSEKLAFDMRLILNKLGVLSNISNRGRVKDSTINNRKIISRHDVYSIVISGDSARNLANIIGVNYDGGIKTTGQFGYVGKEYFLIPIIKIENFEYMGNVYNLEVEEDESYSTFNGVVHNCFSKHTLSNIVSYIELANRKLSEGKKDEAINYLNKSKKWLGLFMIKNKL